MDFANTLPQRDRAGHERGWEALVRFLEAAGALDIEQAGRLRVLGESQPARCAGAVLRALELRAVIRQILDAIAQRQPPAIEWIDVVNRALRSSRGAEQLLDSGEQWRLAFVSERHDPLVALAPIARSAASLLAEGPEAPVRRCAGPKCVLYFYDQSRTRRRRWCSMAACGNRSKVAAHARRLKARRLG